MIKIPNKTYGYLRISTESQNISNNKNWILQKANDLKIGPVEWVSETVSGGKDWKKREIGKLLEKANKGDKIITFEVSRIGRNIKQSMEFLACCDRKGVTVYAGDMGEDDSVESSLQTFVAQMTSQRERENIKRRTKTALETRQKLGMILGQPKGIMNLDKNGKGIFRNENNEEIIHNLINEGIKIKNLAERYKVHPIIMGKYINKWDLKKPKEIRDQDKINEAIKMSEKAKEDYLKNQTLKPKKENLNK